MARASGPATRHVSLRRAAAPEQEDVRSLTVSAVIHVLDYSSPWKAARHLARGLIRLRGRREILANAVSRGCLLGMVSLLVVGQSADKALSKDSSMNFPSEQSPLLATYVSPGLAFRSFYRWSSFRRRAAGATFRRNAASWCDPFALRPAGSFLIGWTSGGPWRHALPGGQQDSCPHTGPDLLPRLRLRQQMKATRVR